METGSAPLDYSYTCSICDKTVGNRTELIEHLRLEHEILEVASYAAGTMIADQDRDRTAQQFHARFEHLKEELVGRDSKS